VDTLPIGVALVGVADDEDDDAAILTTFWGGLAR
jgi:hypothetical protein